MADLPPIPGSIPVGASVIVRSGERELRGTASAFSNERHGVALVFVKPDSGADGIWVRRSFVSVAPAPLSLGERLRRLVR